MDRMEINAMFRRAEAKRDYPGDYFQLKNRAEAALAAWREAHPVEAAAEEAQALHAQAEALRNRARGALTYDADGWLGPDDQQRAHDEDMTKADELDAQASALGTTVSAPKTPKRDPWMEKYGKDVVNR